MLIFSLSHARSFVFFRSSFLSLNSPTFAFSLFLTVSQPLALPLSIFQTLPLPFSSNITLRSFISEFRSFSRSSIHSRPGFPLVFSFTIIFSSSLSPRPHVFSPTCPPFFRALIFSLSQFRLLLPNSFLWSTLYFPSSTFLSRILFSHSYLFSLHIFFLSPSISLYSLSSFCLSLPSHTILHLYFSIYLFH